MSGIVFLRTNDLDAVRRYYVERVGCRLWLEQAVCIILRHGNLLLGFCQREELDTQGMITFFYPERKDVDRMYELFKDEADAPPRCNERYNIYHFFTSDPEGRAVEFQSFEHPLEWEFEDPAGQA